VQNHQAVHLATTTKAGNAGPLCRSNSPRARLSRAARRAFTLVEILIVVVILGILAAIATPQFVKATEAASETTALDQLGKIRRAIAVYYVTYNQYPTVTAGDGTWAEILTQKYLREAPINPWVLGTQRRAIVLRDVPDTSYPSPATYGWIYHSASGTVWAAGFDGNDQPFSRP
jgi:general secretion pathway protein G